MSLMYDIFIKDEEAARKAKALSYARNAFEKGNLAVVFTGGGFRLYDKNGYSLLLKDSGMSHIDDGEISDDLAKLAVRSLDNYAYIYDIQSGKKSEKLSLAYKTERSGNQIKNIFGEAYEAVDSFVTYSSQGFTFGKSPDRLFDAAYSEELGESVVNEYDLNSMALVKTHMKDCHYFIMDIGFSKKENKFWLMVKDREAFENSYSVLWTDDFVDFEKHHTSCSLGSAIYNENKEIFIVSDLGESYNIISRHGEMINKVKK